MPTLRSEGDEADAKVAAKRDKITQMLLLILSFSIGAYQIPFQTDAEVVYPSDAARAAKTLANAASFSGVLEFALSPSIGRAADTVGRKFFFILQGLLTSVTYSLIAIQGGTSLPLVLAGKVCRSMNFSMCSASGVLALTMYSDVLTPKEFVVARANMVAVSGIVSFVMPLVGSALMRQRAGLRKVYAATAVLAFAQAVVSARFLPETLELRKPFKPINPFGFVKLFTFNRSMTKMMFASLTTNFVELKNLNDLYITWYRSEVKTSVEQFRSLVGLTMIPSGSLVVPALIKRLGMFGFTTFAGATNALSWLLTAAMPWSRRPSSLMYLSLALMIPGVTGNSGSALRAYAMKYGKQVGLSSGEYAGYQANLKAIAGTVAPALFGNVYYHSKKLGVTPAICWVVVTIICSILPEFMWRAIPRSELPDDQEK